VWLGHYLDEYISTRFLDRTWVQAEACALLHCFSHRDVYLTALMHCAVFTSKIGWHYLLGRDIAHMQTMYRRLHRPKESLSVVVSRLRTFITGPSHRTRSSGRRLHEYVIEEEGEHISTAGDCVAVMENIAVAAGDCQLRSAGTLGDDHSGIRRTTFGKCSSELLSSGIETSRDVVTPSARDMPLRTVSASALCEVAACDDDDYSCRKGPRHPQGHTSLQPHALLADISVGLEDSVGASCK
jgi:hypothetical protein